MFKHLYFLLIGCLSAENNLLNISAGFSPRWETVKVTLRPHVQLRLLQQKEVLVSLSRVPFHRVSGQPTGERRPVGRPARVGFLAASAETLRPAPRWLHHR